MADNSATLPQGGSATAAAEEPLKGKGKASTAEEPVDTTMDEDDDDEDDDEEEEAEAGEEDADDNLDEIDLNNIVDGGRRTRGRVIDWAKAAQDHPAEEDDDDDDEDEYEPAGEEQDQGDKMDED